MSDYLAALAVLALCRAGPLVLLMLASSIVARRRPPASVSPEIRSE